MSCPQQTDNRIIQYTEHSRREACRVQHPSGNSIITSLVWALLMLTLAGCADQPPPYRPPTVAAHPPSTVSTQAKITATSNQQPAGTQVPAATIACSNNLTLVESLSIPDQSVVQPGQSLDKRWLVENSGSCNWDARYRLKLVYGVDLGATTEQAIYPARSGADVTLRILFTAPPEAGKYQSSWQAFDPQGQPFGDPLTLVVLVGSATP